MPYNPEDWNPLRSRMSAEECNAFWYMGRDENIYLYRHADTGRWLYLDGKGNSFTQEDAPGTAYYDPDTDGPYTGKDRDGKPFHYYAPADFKKEYDWVTQWGTATNWGEVGKFERELEKALQQSAPKTPPEPGGGMDR